MNQLRVVAYLFFLSVILIRSVISQTAEEIEKMFNPPDGKYEHLMPKSADFSPYYSWRFHKNGLFWNTVNNCGIIGNFFGISDPEEGRTAASYFFPRYSRIRHGYYTSLWVGGVIGNDTLVSTTLDVNHRGWWSRWRPEFWPDQYPEGDFKEIQKDIGPLFGSTLSRSEVIFESVYSDTFRYNSFVPYSSYDQRYHKPLDLQVRQTSYTWSYQYAEDLMIVKYELTNLGTQDIHDAFVGLFHIGGVNHTAELPYPLLDDLEGFIKTVPYEFEEIGDEVIDLAWTCDRNGNPSGSSWSLISTKNAMGIALLDAPEEANLVNFNWWYEYSGGNWGPRKRGTVDKPLRKYQGELGIPYSDADKYHIMSNPEVDYTGYEAMVDHQDQDWMPPNEFAEDIAEGHYVHYVVSYGPFDIEVGETKSVVVAYAVGEDVHSYGGAYRDMFDPLNPEEFIDYLDFDDLISNVRWAKRIYDNPGVDTDLDGDSGKYFFYFDPVTEESVQVFYEGDGVPDFRGATPPPPPELRVVTSENKINIRWNGRETENYFDTFSLLRDFEGYRVYLARSQKANDIVLLASYDREDYNRWKWNERKHKYELTEIPFTYDSLRAIYGDHFYPDAYDRVTPLIVDGEFYYFTPVDNNQSNLSFTNQIHKLYPDATLDTSDVDEEGRMRYYEYEYTIENLLPSIPYYVSVSAFDFGNPAKSLEPLESSPYNNMVNVFAVNQSDDDILKDNKLNVYVYPNPYIGDGRYAEQGFENRFDDLSVDRSRTIYFANLPHRCTIKILSLDGDLVKQINHNQPKGSGTSSVARFDLISRNTQAVESGLYYWTVESELGNQVGKLVIIK